MRRSETITSQSTGYPGQTHTWNPTETCLTAADYGHQQVLQESVPYFEPLGEHLCVCTSYCTLRIVQWTVQYLRTGMFPPRLVASIIQWKVAFVHRPD